MRLNDVETFPFQQPGELKNSPRQSSQVSAAEELEIAFQYADICDLEAINQRSAQAVQDHRDVISEALPEIAQLLEHPRGAFASLQAGVVVLAGAVINAGATIDDDVIVNTGSIVEHDCQVGSHAHIAPGCCLGGEARIGEGTLLGIGSRILPGIKVGVWCVVGAGAVVTKDVEDFATVVGIPARRLR